MILRENVSETEAEDEGAEDGEGSHAPMIAPLTKGCERATTVIHIFTSMYSYVS